MLPSPLTSHLLVRLLGIQETWVQSPLLRAVWLGLLCVHRAPLSVHTCRTVDAPWQRRFTYRRSDGSGRVRSAWGRLPHRTHANWRSWASVWGGTRYGDSHNLLQAPSLPWTLLKRWQVSGWRQTNGSSRGSLSLFAVLPRKLLTSRHVTMLQELQKLHGSSQPRKVSRVSGSAERSGQQGAASICADTCSDLILHILLSFHTVFHTDVMQDTCKTTF